MTAVEQAAWILSVRDAERLDALKRLDFAIATGAQGEALATAARAVTESSALYSAAETELRHAEARALIEAVPE